MSMPKVVVRNLRRALMALILTGATVLTAPAAGCEGPDAKNTLINAARSSDGRVDARDYLVWQRGASPV
jgi:hypothetical protein